MNLFQAVITPALQHDKRTSQAKTSGQRGQLEVMAWKRLQSQDFKHRQCSGGQDCDTETWLEDTGRVLHFLGRQPQPLKDQNGRLSSQVGEEPIAGLAPLTQRLKVQHMNLFQAGITPALQHDKRTSQAKTSGQRGQLEVMAWKRLQSQDFNYGLGCFRRRTWLEDTGRVLHFWDDSFSLSKIKMGGCQAKQNFTMREANELCRKSGCGAVQNKLGL